MAMLAFATKTYERVMPARHRAQMETWISGRCDRNSKCARQAVQLIHILQKIYDDKNNKRGSSSQPQQPAFMVSNNNNNDKKTPSNKQHSSSSSSSGTNPSVTTTRRVGPHQHQYGSMTTTATKRSAKATLMMSGGREEVMRLTFAVICFALLCFAFAENKRIQRIISLIFVLGGGGGGVHRFIGSAGAVLDDASHARAGLGHCV